MYNKNSGIYILLQEYIPIYIKNMSWLISFFISIFLTAMIVKGNIPIDFIDKILKLGLSIFPPIFALSLTSVSFLLSLYDRDNLRKIRIFKTDVTKDKKISLYQKTILSFMFFLFIIASTIIFFWISNILFEINYMKNYINNNITVLVVLIWVYIFQSLLVLFTSLDIVSTLYTFSRLQIYLMDQTDQKQEETSEEQ